MPITSLHRNSTSFNRIKSLDTNASSRNWRNTCSTPFGSKHSKSTLSVLTASNFDKPGMCFSSQQEITIKPTEFCLLDRKFARKSLSRRSLNLSKVDLKQEPELEQSKPDERYRSEMALNKNEGNESSEKRAVEVDEAYESSEKRAVDLETEDKSESLENLTESKYFRQISRFVTHPRRSKLYKKDIKGQISQPVENFKASSDIQRVSRITSHISSPNHFHIPKHEIGDKNKMMPYRNGRIGRNDEKTETMNHGTETTTQNPARKLMSDKTNRNNSNFDYRSYMKSILAQPRQESSIFNDEFIKH